MPTPYLLSSRRRLCLLTSSIFIKAVLMTLTPMSLELTYLLLQISQPSLQAVKWNLTPYGIMVGYIVNVWRMIPVDHPVVSSAWTPDFFHASEGLYLLVFMVKLPLLLLDIVTGIALYRMLLAERVTMQKAAFGFFLWFLNPYVLLFNEMWAAVDIIPTLLLLLVLFLLQVRRTLSGATAYALAIAAKLFPILILPIFPVIRRRSKFTVLFLLAGFLGVTGYIAWTAYAKFNPAFQLQQYSPFTQNFDEYKLRNGDVSIGLATIALIFVYAFLAMKWPRDGTRHYEPTLIILLVFYAFSNWYPQFLIWMIPFLVLDAVYGGRRLAYMIVLLSSALFFNLVASAQYFTAYDRAFFFIPADSSILKGAIVAFDWFTQQYSVAGFFLPFYFIALSKALFILTCLVYALMIAEKRTRVFTSLLYSIATRE